MNEIDNHSYLRRIPALKNLRELKFNIPITFFTGENGSGKSTLLEAIAIEYGFNPEGGTKNYNFSTYDSHEELHDEIRLIYGYRCPKGGYFLRAESFYNVATKEKEYWRICLGVLNRRCEGPDIGAFLYSKQKQREKLTFMIVVANAGVCIIE